MGTCNFKLAQNQFWPHRSLLAPIYVAVKMSRYFVLMALVLVVATMVQSAPLEDENQGMDIDARDFGDIKNNAAGNLVCKAACLISCPNQCCRMWPREFTNC